MTASLLIRFIYVPLSFVKGFVSYLINPDRAREAMNAFRDATSAWCRRGQTRAEHRMRETEERLRRKEEIDHALNEPHLRTAVASIFRYSAYFCAALVLFAVNWR